MKRILILLCAVIFLFAGCGTAKKNTDLKITASIKLSDDKIAVDGADISEDSTSSVYAAKDIVFYLEGQGFTYGEGSEADEHSRAEADKHTVVHITEPGIYEISGKLSAGQIAVDLGDDAEGDKSAAVTLYLNNADITCTVAPAVIFYNVYECGSKDEATANSNVDTSSAGANVIIADGSENNINGSYVAKIYKSYTLSENGDEVIDSKKLHKYDGAFYSRMSMNISGGSKGDGVLNITAENEGLDSELHLTVNGGNININSGNDGINTNEDNISVTTINGGNLNIKVNGSTGEGDGIDSNGWLVINGGELIASACSTSEDAGIDSDKGIILNGGKIIATGNMLDTIAQSNITYTVFSFANRQQGNQNFTLKNSESKAVGEYTPENDFSYLLIADDSIAADTYTLWYGNAQYQGTDAFAGGMQKPNGNMPPVEIPSGELTFPEGNMPSSDMPNNRPDNGEMNQPEYIPDDFSMPDGGFNPQNKPEMPRDDGENPIFDINHENFGNMQPGISESITLKSEFIIKSGANYFSQLSPINEYEN